MYVKQTSKLIFMVVATKEEATHIYKKGKGFIPLEDDLDRLEREINIFRRMGFSTGELEMVKFPDGHSQIQPRRAA